MRKGPHVSKKEEFSQKLAQVVERFQVASSLSAEPIVISEAAAQSLQEAIDAVRLQVATIVALLANLDTNLQNYNNTNTQDTPLGWDQEKVVILKPKKEEEVAFLSGKLDQIPKEIFDAIRDTAADLREKFELDVGDVVTGDTTIQYVDHPNMNILEKVSIDFNTLWDKAGHWVDAVAVNHAHAIKDNRKHAPSGVLPSSVIDQLTTAFNNDVANIRDFAKQLGGIEESFTFVINPTAAGPGAKPN